MGVLIETPRVNANEDQLQIIEIRVSQGQSVDQGDVVFVLETTKAAVEVTAPQSGILGSLRNKVGDFVAVGSVLCEISASQQDAGSAQVVTLKNSSEQQSVTAKARKLAEEFGVNLADVVPTNGRIGEAEVRAAAVAQKVPAAKQEQSAQDSPKLSDARRAIIIGGGGHAACLIDALQSTGFNIIGCTDQKLPVGHHVCGGISVIGTENILGRLRSEGVQYAFIGIGGAQNSIARRAMFERAVDLGFVIPPVIHPSATVSLGTTIGAGCHILAGATVGPRCSIGNNVLVNQGSILCHDSLVGDHSHLTPGAIVAGGVKVGSMTVIGMGVTVLFGVTIGANVLIHNGAHVTTNVADNTVVDGRGVRSDIKSN